MKILTDNGLVLLWQKIKDLYKKTSVSAKQTTTSTADGGTNVMTFTFGDGTSTTLSVKNGSKGSDGARGATGAKGEKGDRGPVGETGPQGNSGITDASNKALINDAVTGGETSYLSAEVGKLGILTYDCSKGGSVTHATLQDAINSVPTTFQKVGLTIIYKSGDTIYRYVLNANTWSANPANWYSVDSNLKELLDVFSLQDNEEYLAVERDAEGKVLSSTNPDGSHYLYKVKSETIPEEFEHIEDPEGRMGIVTDAEGKVLAYRDFDGTMHENSFATKTLTVNGKEYQETLNQCKRESIDAINNLELSEINGIEDHGKENLYTGYTKRYTTADGKQTFISPNESLGGVFCNPIRCSAGEFFTRTGIATAIVVVSDKNDNNAQRVYQPSGALPGNTFQIPETWDWAYYLRCVCMSTDRELAIMRGKYAIKKSEQDGKLRIPEMKLSIANFTKETKYISSPNGKMYEIAVDNDGQLYAKEIDKDVIFPSDIPSNFKFTLVNNLSKGEKLPFDRFITNIDSYVGIWNANGVCAYKDLSPVTLNANWEYHKNSRGEGRYMCVNGYDAEGFPKGFSVYNEQFELVDNVVGKFDNHDYIYIDDGHYILFNETIHQVTIDGKEYTPKIPTIYEYKNGEVIAQRLLDDQIIMNDLAPTDYFRSETHVNSLGFDGEDETRIIINPRHCMSFFILERKISGDGSVTFGNIVAQIGGLHTSNHYDVDSRIKTEDKCQWFLCHDVKKWGTKDIKGKSYPVYTLFDNNLQDTLNVNNPSGGQPSRIIQMAIDFENKKIIEYKIYQIEEYKSDIMSSAFMFDEGKIFINYARQPICGYYDFTTAATVISGNTYTGAVKKLEFHSGTNTPYRVNPFNV